jgi:hypothetical protein
MNTIVTCEVCFETKPIWGKCNDQNCNRGFCEECTRTMIRTMNRKCPVCRNPTLVEAYGKIDEIRDSIVDINTIKHVQIKGKPISGKIKKKYMISSEEFLHSRTRKKLDMKDLKWDEILAYFRFNH